MTTAAIRVQVLNASYEQVGTTKLTRAISMIRDGKAVVEEADPHRQLHHKSGQFAMPKIIRLLQYIKVPVKWGPKVWTKAGVLERDEFKCAYCRKKGRNIVQTVDHVLPQAQGGRDTWENTVACCSRCNGKKANRTPEQAHMTLLFEPFVPMRMYISTKK